MQFPNSSLRFTAKIIGGVLVFILGIFKIASAQTPDSLLAQLNANDFPEKIYIHYDKPTYFAGETIWFKAYLMEGFYPASKSTVLAVELLNDSGTVVDKKKLPIRSGAAVGEFSLRADLLQGIYTVRAYTRRHMNSGIKKRYHHSINIYNPLHSKQPATTHADSSFVNFFPEGGNFIANVSNTLAFKCADRWGNPKNIKGKILDSKGSTVTTFESTHNGMGKIIFTPGPGEKYVAECEINSAEIKIVSLPDMLGQGVALRVNQAVGKMVFNLNTSSVNIPALMPAYVLGVSENMVAFKIPVNSNNKEIQGKIPVENLPSGILQITVFNSNNQPLAERLVFVNSGDYIPANIFKTDTLDLKKRQKNVFSFALQEAAAGTYSVSVTALNDDGVKADDIVSRLLITDDLKGPVYDPGYYFEKNDEEHTQNLDLVMLTNGWRRYNWNELVSYANRPPDYKDPGYITFSAIAVNPVTNMPFKNKALAIFVKTKDNFSDFLGVTTDSTGLVKIPDLMFEDTLSLTFTSATNKQEKLRLQLRHQDLSKLFFLPKYNIPVAGFHPVDQNSAYFKSNQNKIQSQLTPSGVLLEELKIITKAKTDKQKFEDKYTTGRLGSSANKEIDFLSEPPINGTNIFDYLRSKVAGVNISGGPLDYTINYRGTRSLTGGPIPMAVFLDEFQVEPRDIAMLPVSQVAMLKVFGASPLTGPGGALAIYTRRDGGSRTLQSEKVDVKLEGFSPTKEFFSPAYGDERYDRIAADDRSTLYWNPYLATTAQNGKVSFSFYNSDTAKEFKVVVEGVLEDGKLLHIERVLK